MCEQPPKIVGAKFERNPIDSTLRYTLWANSLTPQQLNVQVYTSHGPTVIMPTWFCSRKVFERYVNVSGIFVGRAEYLDPLGISYVLWHLRAVNKEDLCLYC